MGLLCSSPNRSTCKYVIVSDVTWIMNTKISCQPLIIRPISPCTEGPVELQWWPSDPDALCRSNNKKKDTYFGFQCRLRRTTIFRCGFLCCCYSDQPIEPSHFSVFIPLTWIKSFKGFPAGAPSVVLSGSYWKERDVHTCRVHDPLIGGSN